jgi:hypothetical protein
VKKQKEEVPLQYFERNYGVLAIALAITLGLSYWSYIYIVDVNAWGFMIGAPAVMMVFNTLWLMLNPYAIIYEDRFEIKKSVISNKVWYFIDIHKVSELKGSGFEIVYNDQDVEFVSITGIRPSHRTELRAIVNKYVCKSLVERED